MCLVASPPEAQWLTSAVHKHHTKSHQHSFKIHKFNKHHSIYSTSCWNDTSIFHFVNVFISSDNMLLCTEIWEKVFPVLIQENNMEKCTLFNWAVVKSIWRRVLIRWLNLANERSWIFQNKGVGLYKWSHFHFIFRGSGNIRKTILNNKKVK